MNWGLFVAAVLTTLLLAWAVQAWRKRPSRVALIVSFALMLVAGINAAAPVRGWIDPGYMGYVFGLIRADMGPVVTVLAGSVFLSSVVAAVIALRERRGPRLWFVCGTCGVFTVLLGAPWVLSAIQDPGGNVIQFGEYLTIPGPMSSVLLLTLLVAPFALGTVWAGRAARRPRLKSVEA